MPTGRDKRQIQEGIAQTALTEMSRREIAPVPGAYAVWFTHLDGGDQDLSAALRARDGAEAKLDEDGCAELYRRFIAGAAGRAANQVSGKLQGLLQRLGSQLSTLDEGAQRYGDALGVARETVSQARSVNDIGELIGEILQETTTMQGAASQLARDLQAQAEQVNNLRSLLEMAQQEASRDGLTGVANRRRFDEALAAAALEAEVTGAPVCLVMADVDHFKSFNDRFGHAMGDLVLKQVAQLLRASLKGHDLVARYGGEEFAMILPDTKLDDAFTVANKIRWVIGSRDIVQRQSGQSLGRVTLSMGVSDFQPGEPVDDWLERADKALYTAKRDGRNRVVASAGKQVVRAAKFESGWSKRS